MPAARRRRSQTRPTKGSGRPINIVTTLAGSGTAVTVAWTENPSETEVVELGIRLMVMTFVNVYGTVAREEIVTNGASTLTEPVPGDGTGYNEVMTELGGTPEVYVLWTVSVLGGIAET